MKVQTPIHFLLLVFHLLIASSSFAQLDSLYTQQWNRDPIKNLQSTTSAQRQIITAEQIRVSGYTQLSHVLQLIDGWTISNTENNPNHPQLKSNGVGNYNHQNWVFMLNGQRIEMNRSPALDINQLGVSVVDVERIEIVNTNGMYLGEFTQNGLINIITKKNTKNGFGYRGYYANDLTSSDNNLEGFNTSHNLSYSKGKFTISNTLSYLEDANWGVSVNKSLPIFNYDYTLKQYSNRIETHYSGTKNTHQLSASYTKKEDYPDENFYQAGYLGLYTLNSKNQLRLSTNYSYNTSTTTDAKLLTNTIQHRLLKPYKNGNLIWQTGIGTDYYAYKYQYSFLYLYRFPNSDTSVIILKPYTSINIPVTRKTNLFSDVQVAFAHGKIAPKLSVGMYKRVSLISNYSFMIAYTESLLEESFLTTVNQDINAIGGAPYYYNPKIATADFYYNLNFGNNVKLSFNSGLKNAYDLPDFNYNIITLPKPNTIGYAIVKTNKRATYQLNWVNRINLHYDIVKNLVFDINYLHTSNLNTWNENLRNIPKHKFTVVLQYDFKNRFTIWSRNYLQSKTNWFGQYSEDGYYSYPSIYFTKPMLFSWDIGLSKKLWKDYIHLNLTARNIVTSNKTYFNNSTPFNTSVFVSVSANIDGIGKAKTTNP